MRKRIILSLALIFCLFTVGALVTVYYLVVITSDLRSVISLHEIEDIRQDFSMKVQKVQRYAYSSAEEFASELDTILDTATEINDSIEMCHTCHHEPRVEQALLETSEMMAGYEEKLSYLITTATEGTRRQHYRSEVVGTGDLLVTRVEQMVRRAASSVSGRTTAATAAIRRSFTILFITLSSTLVAALVVAQYLSTRFTRPVSELMTATQRVAAGDFGYRAASEGVDEFATLIGTFNDMSGSLAEQEERIRHTVQRLDRLNRFALPLNTAHDTDAVVSAIGDCMPDLIGAEIAGVLLPDPESRGFAAHWLHLAGERASGSAAVTESQFEEVCREHEGAPIVTSDSGAPWPLPFLVGPRAPSSFIVVWLTTGGARKGALFAVMGAGGTLTPEDLNLLGILADKISVATDNIRLYQDLQQQMAELRETQNHLIQAEKLTALGTLAGGVAHDFNNILTGIIGVANSLKNEQTTGSREYQALDRVEKAGFRASKLTQQLLAFARREPMQMQAVSVNDSVHSVIGLFETTTSKRTAVEVSLAGDLPPVLGDQGRLEQVLMNLLVNARDALPSQGTITVRTDAVDLDREFCDANPRLQPGQHVRLVVADTGAGIHEDVLPRIFEPFFTTKEVGKGTGLGLAMTYGIVESHGGVCLVDTKLGEGTQFSILLPVIDLSMPAPAAPPDRGGRIGRTLLLVDDEPMVTDALANRLRNLGCTVYVGADGKAGVDLLAAHADEIELVVLDLNMPVMDGAQAFRQMKTVRPDLKVLIATGHAAADAAEALVQQGASGFVQKPFIPDQVADRIREILETSSR